MPYRDQATVESWVASFLETLDGELPDISVLEQYYTEGPETGLVVVSLRNASTVTYLQPSVRDGQPVWLIHFEAREDAFDLDGTEVARLAEDLLLLSRLCNYLQGRTDASHPAVA